MANSFSFTKELKDTSKEKMTSQRSSRSINDQSATRDLKGFVLPVIDIRFNFLSTATFVKKASVVNLKSINKCAEKNSSYLETVLSLISTAEQKGMKSAYDFTSPTTSSRSTDRQLYTLFVTVFLSIQYFSSSFL